MTYSTAHPLFCRTQKALSRLSLGSQLFAAGVSGAFCLLCAQALVAKLSSSSSHPPQRHVPLNERHFPIPRPAPVVIVAAGLPRTGSTWVYNVLRILLRIRDPNSIAGWYADLIAIWKNHKTHKYDSMKMSWLDAYASLNTTLLLKMHGPGPFKLFSRGKPLGVAADLTVLTHRDLRSEVRSWVYQNWNSSIHAGDIGRTPFGDPTQWVRVARHILTERKATLASVGEGKYLDIRYEDWTGRDIETQIHVIAEIARELKWEYTHDELHAVAVETARLEPPAIHAALKYNPVNKLHPGHTRVHATNLAFQAALDEGYKAISGDPECFKFLAGKNYI